jgi:hypothetical protein
MLAKIDEKPAALGTSTESCAPRFCGDVQSLRRNVHSGPHRTAGAGASAYRIMDGMIFTDRKGMSALAR